MKNGDLKILKLRTKCVRTWNRRSLSMQLNVAPTTKEIHEEQIYPGSPVVFNFPWKTWEGRSATTLRVPWKASLELILPNQVKTCPKHHTWPIAENSPTKHSMRWFKNWAHFYLLSYSTSWLSYLSYSPWTMALSKSHVPPPRAGRGSARGSCYAPQRAHRVLSSGSFWSLELVSSDPFPPVFELCL